MFASAAANASSHWSDRYDWPGGDGYAGWLFGSRTSADGTYGSATGLPGAPGLWVWPMGDGQYGAGGGQWSFRAPGTTHIQSADFTFAYRNRLLSHHCIDLNLGSADGSISDSLICNPPAPPATQDRVEVTLADPAGATATTARFAITRPDCARPDSPSCTKFIPAASADKDGASLRQVALVLTDDELPSADASGPLKDLAEHYISGQDGYDVVVNGADPGSGVASVALDHNGGEAFRASAACDSHHQTPSLGGRICPDTFSASTSIDTVAWPEGANTLEPTATDLASQTAQGASWRILVDRTGPTAASNFQTDLDSDSGEGSVSWQGGIDPALADGNPGSGLDHFEYRYKRQGAGVWSAWQSTDDSSFAIESSFPGEQVSVEVRGVDVVGNVGETATSDLVIMPGPDCQTDGTPTPDAVGPELYGALPDGQAFDAVTFATPKTQAEVLASLPADAQVLGVVSRALMGGNDVQTTGLTVAPDQDFQQNLDFLNRFTYADIEAARNSYAAALDDASGTLKSSYQTLLDHLDTREAELHTDGGPAISSVALAHDPDVTAAFVRANAGDVVAAAQDTAGTGDECAATAAPQTVRGALFWAASQGPDSTGAPETSVSPGTYRPPVVRIGSSTHEYLENSNDHKVHRYYEVTAQFSFGAAHNWSYWWQPQRRTGIRGFELQVDMDRDLNGQGQSGAFGVVPWMQNPPLPNNDRNYYGVPGIWTANFRCPYPDDYFGDDVQGQYSLTVGSRCRPRASVQVFRWAHVLIPKDTNDRIGASVEPVHYANPSNHVDGFGSELDYCQVRAGTWGSCMFGDIGLKTYHYPQTTVTPDIFYFKAT